MLFLLTAAVIVGGFTIVGLGTVLMGSVEDEADRAIARRYGSR